MVFDLTWYVEEVYFHVQESNISNYIMKLDPNEKQLEAEEDRELNFFFGPVSSYIFMTNRSRA